jgi:hypothetical protein
MNSALNVLLQSVELISEQRLRRAFALDFETTPRRLVGLVLAAFSEPLNRFQTSGPQAGPDGARVNLKGEKTCKSISRRA